MFAALASSGTDADKIIVNDGITLSIIDYTNQDLSGITKSGTPVITVTTAAGAVLDSTKLADATSIIVAVNSGNCTAANVAAIGTNGNKITVNNTITLAVTAYTSQNLSGIIKSGTPVINVTTIDSATLVKASLTPVTMMFINAGTTSITAANLHDFDDSRVTVNDGTLTVTAYTTQDLSDLTYTSGTVNVTTTTGAAIDGDSATDLAPATHVFIGTNITVTATNLAALMATATVTVNDSVTLTVNDYTNQNLAAVVDTGTMDVTTTTGAEIDANSATDLEPATNVYIGVNLIDANAVEAAHLASLMGVCTVTINTGITLAVTAYTTQDLAGVVLAGTGIMNVTTTTGSDIVAATDARLAKAKNVTIGEDASSTAAHLADLITALAINSWCSNRRY